jgi:gamma-glutamyl hercynylcysteine S-oxide synthase
METRVRPPSIPDRAALERRYRENRRRSRELFAIPLPDAYLDRPIPLRLPIVFYDGHIPAFSYNTLMRAALGAPSIDAFFERIFERGIDPADSSSATPRVAVPAWPSRGEVQAFGDAVDRAVLDAFANAELTNDERSPLLERAQAAYTILEHEEMHHETLLYLLHQLPYERKRRNATQPASQGDGRPAPSARIEVGAGVATLGARRDAIAFGWDNEFDEVQQRVAAFEIGANSVTNAEWLEFVRAGGPMAPFWREHGGEIEWLGQFEAMPLPLTWPVYVTWTQAAAYAKWRDARLPTEAEYHRAAYGTPWGEERRYPWGDASPSAMHGNFGLRRYDPEPVGASPAGASAWGVNDLVGNGWEWTSTVFAPLPGFAAMASYPQYSVDFFDDDHYVIKGASPVTALPHIRRSFRNWYRADYPYVYAKFRLVRG